MGVLSIPEFVVFPATGGNRVKKRGSKFLNLTNMPTFAIPKKSVEQCDCVNFWDELPARVAQLVEQLICNQLVGGSSPFSGSGGGPSRLNN
jgi:hypothetical protein